MIIASVNPREGKVGDVVTITGSALDSGPAKSVGAGSVTFNGVKSVPSKWTDTEVVVAVPEGAVSGPLCVAAGGDAVEVPFEVYAESGEERDARIKKSHDEEAKADAKVKADADAKAKADAKAAAVDKK